ncbi:MAG TPA: sulfotransferase, partial [Woeseiaceae bacterium]|nr:sulfotransferase [Woeseiaceae bacterium]
MFRRRQMKDQTERLSRLGRSAWAKWDWATVEACAAEILRLDAENAEGHFLSGLVEKAATRPINATKAFEKALALDPQRYDAAIELAGQHSVGRRNAQAAELIARYEPLLGNSPRYLDMAGTVYTEIGLSEKAWPLYQLANKLQPGVDLFIANMASCAVFLGKIEEAREAYLKLLARFPNHQRNHYRLARLENAGDDRHISQMKAVLKATGLSPDKNVFIYYAIGKELEDLGRWSEAFEYYRKAGDAVMSVAKYDISEDLKLIDTIIDCCNQQWLREGRIKTPELYPDKTPIFIVGLPRTGTTLTDRILSSHSRVQSLGETQFMQMVLRQISGVSSIESMNAAMIEGAATKDILQIGRDYLQAVDYRLGEKPMFIDKLPYNFLFLGFIAKAYPHARIVHLRRNPMDSCFSMYKQVFTWAYKFSYSLENLGRYYVAHERLRAHWLQTIGDRIVEVRYEDLVADQESQTRTLLDRLGLDFEQACLDFDKNKA